MVACTLSPSRMFLLLASPGSVPAFLDQGNMRARTTLLSMKRTGTSRLTTRSFSCKTHPSILSPPKRSRISYGNEFLGTQVLCATMYTRPWPTCPSTSPVRSLLTRRWFKSPSRHSTLAMHFNFACVCKLLLIECPDGLSQAAHKMARFPPSTNILCRVKMTRTAYAQLLGQKFYPPKIFGTFKEREGTAAWRWRDVGMKLVSCLT